MVLRFMGPEKLCVSDQTCIACHGCLSKLIFGIISQSLPKLLFIEKIHENGMIKLDMN